VKYWYDTEFIEDGATIDLISIGIVAEDGREYYAINHGAPWKRIKKHAWLMANVVSQLPRGYGEARPTWPRSWLFDMTDRAVKFKEEIAAEVRDFLVGRNERVELWGYYCAYDHVVLAQLWGTMMQLPPGIPMWTNDIMQIVAETGLEASLPAQQGNAHNALDDARWTREAWEYLNSRRAVTS
jgi:hypothetical protein